VDKSLLAHVLPYLENVALYNAINHDLAIISGENQSIHRVADSTFACPSDPLAGWSRTLNPGALEAYGCQEPAMMVFTSYAGCVGSTPVIAQPLPKNGCRVPPLVLAQSNGAFNDLSPLRFSSITDGLSHTILLAEKSVTSLSALDEVYKGSSAQHGWYVTGNWGDTLFASFYPPNASRLVSPIGARAWSDSASSLHPGGLNAVMGDGSVVFIKETVQSWPVDAVTGNPSGASQLTGGWWSNLPRPGVWQALSTRSGSEIVDAAAE
jgi:prepilin-type processing-associated H-X9-DG protein